MKGSATCGKAPEHRITPLRRRAMEGATETSATTSAVVTAETTAAMTAPLRWISDTLARGKSPKATNVVEAKDEGK